MFLLVPHTQKGPLAQSASAGLLQLGSGKLLRHLCTGQVRQHGMSVVGVVSVMVLAPNHPYQGTVGSGGCQYPRGPARWFFYLRGSTTLRAGTSAFLPGWDRCGVKKLLMEQFQKFEIAWLAG
jgi:hypothetical protein